MEVARTTLEQFMFAQVALRRAEVRQELAGGNMVGPDGEKEVMKDDVFSRLVLANESEQEKLPMDDEELVGASFPYFTCHS